MAWGAYHALLFAPLLLAGKNRKFTDNIVAQSRPLPNFRETLQMGVTFGLVVIGWIIFRSDTITDAIHYISGIFDRSLFSMPDVEWRRYPVIAVTILLIVEWTGRRNQFALAVMPQRSFVRYSNYFVLIMLLLALAGKQATFIYFQF